MSLQQTLPTDPVLPQLARALDPAAMAEVFGEALHGLGARLEQCQVERIKYRPRRNCTLSYRLQLHDLRSGRGFEQRVAARLCGGDAAQRLARAAAMSSQPSPVGPGLRLLPALDMLTWWWPNDAKLDAPRLFADERAMHEQVLPELVAALSAGRGRLVEHTLAVAQYVPEQRLTARVELRWTVDGRAQAQRVYAKSSGAGGSAAAHQALRTLQGSSAWATGRLRTPRALLLQPAHALHWQSAAAGTALLDLPRAQALALAAPLGAQLAALHGVPTDGLPMLTPAGLRTRLAEVAALLGEALPQARDDLREAVVRLGDGLLWLAGAPAATLHGDLHPRNVLADGERLTLIDLDSLHRGPALLELGAWVAEGIYRALLDGAEPRRDEAAWQALLDGHARGGGTAPAAPALAWATAWNLLTQRAWRCVVNLKPGRFAIAPRLVALTAQLAAAGRLDGLR